MSSNPKKQRVALIGKATVSNKKNKNSEDDDIVSEIIKTMDENSKYSNQKIEAYQSMIQHRNNKASRSRMKSDALDEDLTQMKQTKPFLNQPKKIFPLKKPPLMVKCQKNLKYIKHNRAIPKQRAHVGSFEMSPKEASTKTQVRKRQRKETVPNIKKKIAGNIWMVNAIQNRKLQSSDSSEEEDIVKKLEPPVTEAVMSSDSESDYENFIKSHKELMPDPHIPSSSSKKHKTSRKLNKVQLKEKISKRKGKKDKNLKNVKKRKSVNDFFDSSSDNSSLFNNDSDIQSEQSKTDNNPQDERATAKLKVNEINENSETSHSIPVKEQVVSEFPDCSVILKRMPAIDQIGIDRDLRLEKSTCVPENATLQRSENNMIIGDEIAGITIKEEIDDDCMIIAEIPISRDDRGSANKPYRSDLEDESVSPGSTIPISNNSERNGSVPPPIEDEPSEITHDGNSHNSSEKDKDSGIKISFVTSLGEISNETSNTKIPNQSVTHSDLQKSKEYFDEINVELLNKTDVEGTKKVISPPRPEGHSDNSCNKFIALSQNDTSSNLNAKDTIMTTSTVFSKETSLAAESPLKFQNTAEHLCNLPANRSVQNTVKKSELKKILAITNADNCGSEHEQLNSCIRTAPQMDCSPINDKNYSSESDAKILKKIENCVKDSTEHNFSETNKPFQVAKNNTQQNYADCVSDELDAIAFSSVENLCNETKSFDLSALFKLYAREKQTLNFIRSADDNLSETLKVLEEGLTKRVKQLEISIENLCRHHPCFYKVMDEGNFIKPTKMKGKYQANEGTSKILKDAPNVMEVQNRIVSNQQKALCQNCGERAVIKCLGCLKVFFCSEKCGLTYWQNGHYLECKKEASTT